MMRGAIASVLVLIAAQTPAQALDCTRFNDIIKPVLADFKGKPGEYTIDAKRLLQPTPANAFQCTALPSSVDRAKASLHCEYRFGSEEVARALYQSYVTGVTACQPDQKAAKSSAPLKEGEVERSATRNIANDKAWLFRLMRDGNDWKVVVVGAAVPVIPWED
jgi:hypothetical protein